MGEVLIYVWLCSQLLCQSDKGTANMYIIKNLQCNMNNNLMRIALLLTAMFPV